MSRDTDSLPQEDRQTRLRDALISGNTEIVREIKEQSDQDQTYPNQFVMKCYVVLANLDIEDSSKLVGAINCIKESGLDINEAEYNRQELNLLLRASYAGRNNLVTALLACGANPNVVSQRGTPAVTYAARKGDAQIVRALVDAGANLDRIDRDGKTALDYAIARGHSEVVRALGAEADALSAAAPEAERAVETASTARVVEQRQPQATEWYESGSRVSAEQPSNELLKTKLDEFSRNIKTPGFLLSKEAGEKLQEICTITGKLGDKLNETSIKTLKNTLKDVEKHAPGKWDTLVERIRKFIGIKTQKYDIIIQRNNEIDRVKKKIRDAVSKTTTTSTPSPVGTIASTEPTRGRGG
jgi:ankyrin repeat protein